jgi:ubiquinone/menaquinone biosynthesis C-methylase UbiE
MNTATHSGQYALATGANAVGRLDVLHSIYSSTGRIGLIEAGLKVGMTAADFGCGSGTMTRLLAAMVGPSGRVTGIDLNAPQVEQAKELCARQGLTNSDFIVADACRTNLPRDAFDLVYCRFLLLHLPDPMACLREMLAVLKPGGILFVEDGDLASATSVPPTALDMFADLFGRLGPIRGVDYSVANRLAQMVMDAGLSDIGMKIHQPAERAGATGLLLKWSVEEAAPAFIEEGLTTRDELDWTLKGMKSAAEDPKVIALAPRMSLVWGRKPVPVMKK